jgi:glycosyltransferase involved in cell wall biosynthesis
VKVLITAAQFSSSTSGVQRHAFNLVRCLLKQPEIAAVHFILAPWQRELVCSSGLDSMDRVITQVADMDQSVLSRNLWYYRRLPHVVRQIQPDIVHLSYPVPVNASSFRCPVVLTLHDLYPFEIPGNFGFPRVLFNRFILQHCLRDVDVVACVSDTTISTMQRYMRRSIWKKTVRIYNCVEAEPVCDEQIPIPGWHGEPFLLSVAQHRKNKNIPLLIEAFHRLLRDCRIHPDMKLVVIGIPGPETDRIHRLVSDLRLDGRMIFLHGLPEGALQWCYRNCEVLVAPSETEGFGFPVAEALLAGCRVVCSDLPAFREIDQQHCRFIALGPGVEERLADGIAASVGLPRAPAVSLPQFSSATLGAQYVNLYRGLLPPATCPLTELYQRPVMISAPETALAMTGAATPALKNKREDRDHI